MKKFASTLAVVGALSAMAIFTTAAQAVPGALSSRLGTATADLNLLEKTQLFIFGGRHYCFYIDGWHGPGWYWCGYRYRRGFGWGGPEGWHGWHHGGIRGRIRGGHAGGHWGVRGGGYGGGHGGGYRGGHGGGHRGGHGGGGGGHGGGRHR